MFKPNYLVTVVVASIYLIDAAQSVRLPSNIQKCRPHDGACFSRIFTQLMQHSKDYPELNIPDFQLYQPRQTWTLYSPGCDFLNFFGFTAHTSDISIYGLHNPQIHQFRGLRPNPNDTDIYAEVTFPWLTLISNFEANVKLLSLLQYPTSGYLSATSTCVRVPLRIKCDIVERNGEQYVRIKDIRASLQILCDFKMDLKFHTLIPEMIKGVINEQESSKWGQLKSLIETDIEKYLSKIVYDFFTPIFAKVAMREFFLGSNGYQ